MATATEKAYVVARLDELEPAPLIAPDATDDGRQRFDVRRRFGITSFGTNAYRAPSEVDVIREHDEIAARRGWAGGALHRPERRGDVRDRR